MRVFQKKKRFSKTEKSGAHQHGKIPTWRGWLITLLIRSAISDVAVIEAKGPRIQQIILKVTNAVL